MRGPPEFCQVEDDAPVRLREPAEVILRLPAVVDQVEVEPAVRVRVFVVVKEEAEPDEMLTDPAAAFPIPTDDVEVPVLMFVGWLLFWFIDTPPDPDWIEVDEVAAKDPRTTVFAPVPPVPRSMV